MKRKPAKGVMGTRPSTRVNHKHKQWVRGCICAVKDAGRGTCSGKVEFAHVRGGTDGGMGLKPSDKYGIPLCAYHHKVQHTIGEARFQDRHGIDMKALAAEYARRSPHWRDE